MPDVEKLKKLSANDLLQAPRAREKVKESPLPTAGARSGDLAEFDDDTLVSALRANQRVIYGTDDRVDVFELASGRDLDDVDSVVALFRDTDVSDNGDGTSTLRTRNFGTAQRLCPGERFREQPIGAFCSGFLVAPDIIQPPATA